MKAEDTKKHQEKKTVINCKHKNGATVCNIDKILVVCAALYNISKSLV